MLAAKILETESACSKLEKEGLLSLHQPMKSFRVETTPNDRLIELLDVKGRQRFWKAANVEQLANAQTVEALGFPRFGIITSRLRLCTSGSVIHARDAAC